jgi:hypothetical protein
MSDDDVRYFRERAQEERRLAELATNVCARRAHERIANEYDRISTIAESPTLRIVAG